LGALEGDLGLGVRRRMCGAGSEGGVVRRREREGMGTDRRRRNGLGLLRERLYTLNYLHPRSVPPFEDQEEDLPTNKISR
jgi:hypothetical protein